MIILVINIVLYFFSFFIIWWGAGLIIEAVDKISKKINLSQFAVSFFVLGILTSIPEFAVGLSSIIDRDPEIFVGNLIGGNIVLFLLVIPILAIFGRGIKLVHQLNTKNLLFSLLLIATPAFLIADKKFSLFEAVFLIVLYGILLYTIEKKKGVLEKVRDKFIDEKTHLLKELGKIIFGVIFVFISSNFIVDKTIYFSQIYHISPFVISLLFLSLGTNLPEISLAIRSVISKKKEVAFGDYIGSAAANSLLIGLLTLLNGGKVTVVNHFLNPFIFTIIGLGFFFYFTRSKNDISMREGLILLLIYATFLLIEVF